MRLWALVLTLLAGGWLTTAGNMAHAQTVTIDAVGDVLLDRGVASQIYRHGYAYPFAGVHSTLDKADIAFANLECPMSTTGKRVSKRVAFKADPKTAASLSYAGIDIVSTANNHAMDCGVDGLVDTIAALESRRVKWTGSGKTLADALTPTIFKVHGLRIAFVGFCDFLPVGLTMRDDQPSIAIATDENIRAAVTAARRQADVVVASFHWGVEYTDKPTDRQRRLAHLAAECGADLVLGHHPHVLQGIEIIKGKRTCLVDYSLGNFVFDTHLPYDKSPEQSIILKVALGRHGLRSASFVPITIDGCVPSIASRHEAVTIEKRLTTLSASLGTSIHESRIQW